MLPIDAMKEKGIVFGAGYLGTRISEYLRYRLSKINIIDTKSLSSFLDSENPEIVINAAAKTGRPNIDWCEYHKEETMQVNTIGAGNLCIESSKRGIFFIHLSSGCIYQGDNNCLGYAEDDEPNFYGPQFYAKTKILSEKILKEFPCLQLRLRMPIDSTPHERNLIDKLKKYSRVIDTQNSMTTVPHMLDAMKILIERKRTGIYNLVNPGTISAAEIMHLYQQIVDSNHKFEVFSARELDELVKGKRSNCYLNTEKLQSEGIKLPEIHQAVKECLVDYKGHLK